jgi:elongation factor 1-gamma
LQHFNLTVSFQLQCFDPETRAAYPNVTRYFTTLVNQPNYKAVYGDVKLLDAAPQAPKPAPKAKEAAKPKAAPAPKPKAAAKDDDDDDEPAPAPKPKHPLDALGPAKSFPLDEWKRQYS